jgi:hypothetical protein
LNRAVTERAEPSQRAAAPTGDYGLSTQLVLRSLGALVAVMGVLVLVAGLLVAAVGVPGVTLTATVVVAVLVVVTGAFLLSRVASLVHFDEDGYRVRWFRGAGVPQARWKDVEDVVTASLAGHDCVVLRLRDGRSTTIPVDVLDVSPSEFLRDLSRRLDAGHGYRRLR